MKLHNLVGRKMGGYVTFGSYWTKGEVIGRDFTLTNHKGMAMPVQTRISARWPDGSVKWAAHTADSTLLGHTVHIEPSVAHKQPEQSIQVEQADEGIYIHANRLSLFVPSPVSRAFAYDVRLNGMAIVEKAYPILQIETRDGASATITAYEGIIDSAIMEETGPLQCVLCYKGRFIDSQRERSQPFSDELVSCGSFPFVARMYVGLESDEIRFTYTFLYDGLENEHYIKGMGIRFNTILGGEPFNRHVKFGTDRNVFHECAKHMWSRIPRMDYLSEQMGDKMLMLSPEEANVSLPVWNRYVLVQDSAQHFAIEKQTSSDCASIDALHGGRAPGTMAVSGSEGGAVFAIRDFWQKYPGGLEVNGLADDVTQCTMWFYSPEVKAMDFRHYAKESYPYTSYEGFEDVQACAYGIGVTCDASVMLVSTPPSNEALTDFGDRVSKPPVFVGEPVYYHKKRAFGYWSLPSRKTEMEGVLENELEKAFEFYKAEVEQRNWYGLFNYGDIMHTYDSIRHVWRYDVGGFAWQNTELVPTYWLWLYFLRTGREDVFTMAEAMSRHTADVDVYHFGPMQGLGSRHNVSHWGCSCKEPRVSMAGHHRPLFYLTGDKRIGDIMDEVKDADKALTVGGHFQMMHDTEHITQVRSGPDWAAFVSNWMTYDERHGDAIYRGYIETGIEDISRSPLQLASGPSYAYDYSSKHLRYIGESMQDTHLVVCMGGPEIWLEAADLLDNALLKKMLIAYAVHYMLPDDEIDKVEKHLIQGRRFHWKRAIAALAGYAAAAKNDRELALRIWRELLGDLWQHGKAQAYTPSVYAHTNDRVGLQEIPWITTNVTSQLCLNLIVAMEFIRDALPQTVAEADEIRPVMITDR